MKIIGLTQGQYSLVDDEDFEKVKKYTWHATRKAKKIWYAKTSLRREENKSRKSLLMHRLILDALPGVEVDHRNGGGLDNRRSNIRLCTRSENQCNRGAVRGSFSKFKGVHFKKREKRWYAIIRIKGKQCFIGTFKEEEEAAKAYNKRAFKEHGEFANLNIIGGKNETSHLF
jgi:hypothetical protein